MIRVITMSGPPSSVKTSVILRAVDHLRCDGVKTGVVKFDCMAAVDGLAYEKKNIPFKIGLSGNLCPDHFFVSNIEECIQWGINAELDILIIESAGLCNRCAPHIKDALAVCDIDCLSGVNTPLKVGPMLKLADIVVITKGDIVSQAEREIFTFKVKQANPKALIMGINWVTGQGAAQLASKFSTAMAHQSMNGHMLRFSMPAAVCSYCLGETKIGEDHQRGYVRKMVW